MASLDALFPELLVHCQGAPYDLVRHAIRRSAREFCARTKIWRSWLACVKSGSSVTTYTPTLPPDACISRLDKVTLDSRPVDIEVPDGMDRDWKAEAQTLDRQAIGDDLVTFTLAGVETSGVVKAYCVLMPSASAATIPYMLAQQHIEKIADGALDYLLRIKGTSFENQDGAVAARGRFEDGVAMVNVQAWRGQSSARPRARIPWA